MLRRALAFMAIPILGLAGCDGEKDASSTSGGMWLASTGDPQAVYGERITTAPGKGTDVITGGSIVRVDLASGEEREIFSVGNPQRFEARGPFLFWKDHSSLYRSQVATPGDRTVVDADAWRNGGCDEAFDDDGTVWRIRDDVLKKRDLAGSETDVVDLQSTFGRPGYVFDCNARPAVGPRFVAVPRSSELLLVAKDRSAKDLSVASSTKGTSWIGMTEGRLYSLAYEGDASSIVTHSLEGDAVGERAIVTQGNIDAGPGIVGDGIAWCADGDRARNVPGNVYFWRPGDAAPRRLAENACAGFVTDATRVIWRDSSGTFHIATP